MNFRKPSALPAHPNVMLGLSQRHGRLDRPSHSVAMPGLSGHLNTTIIPEKQPFPPGLLHKNATIRGNPALIRPFPPKTPGLLHRPSRPPPLLVMAPRHGRLDRPSLAEQHSADTQHVKQQALPPRRGNACGLSYWRSSSYASGFSVPP